MKALTIAALFLASPVLSFVPQSARTQLDISLNANKRPIPQYDPFQLDDDAIQSQVEPKMDSDIKALALAALAIGTPASASAATAFTPNAIPSALAAYGHYAALLGLLGCVMIERLTIKPNMSEDEENLLAITDIVFGFWGLLITYTGYLRATAYEKGFDFYQHEPIFWLKICFLGIFGAGKTLVQTTPPKLPFLTCLLLSSILKLRFSTRQLSSSEALRSALEILSL